MIQDHEQIAANLLLRFCLCIQIVQFFLKPGPDTFLLVTL